MEKLVVHCQPSLHSSVSALERDVAASISSLQPMSQIKAQLLLFFVFAITSRSVQLLGWLAVRALWFAESHTQVEQ